MSRYLELNTEGIVINIIIWDGISEYDHTEYRLIDCSEVPDVSYGWKLVDGTWVKPVEEAES